MNEQSPSSAVFRCNECSAIIEGESSFWNHLSALHLKYFPYRCDYCVEADEIHFTATEDTMKKHTENIHGVKDLVSQF
ncbi:hypothetical protein DdX_17646 [Ditylenchus destructor]|uniref:C2H2-type domain-containing protein n=1 Tax=Ditylenchus destructor TaxID=166010 RepID=A0AAD4MM74_9BILA|nr:hypothetical protein DdX_17646 [Ditylenchus destructor]